MGIKTCMAMVIPLLMVGCSSKTQPQADVAQQSMENNAVQPAQAVDKRQTDDALAKIKQGLLELSNRRDPQIQQIYSRIAILQKNGGATLEQLQIIQGLIDQHLLLVPKSDKSTAVVDTKESGIARDIRKSLGRSNSAVSDAQEVRLKSEISRLIQAGDANAKELVNMFNDFKEGGFSETEVRTLQAKIDEHRQTVIIH